MGMILHNTLALVGLDCAFGLLKFAHVFGLGERCYVL